MEAAFTLNKAGTYVLAATPSTGKSWKASAGTSGITTPPPGLTFKTNRLNLKSIEGTPTEAGKWGYLLEEVDRYGSETGYSEPLTITVAGPAVTIPVPAAQRTEDGYMLPADEGVAWTVNGVDTTPGTYAVEPVTVETTITIVPRALTGYVFADEPVPLVLTFTPPPPPVDPENPEDPEEPVDWSHLLEDDPERAHVAAVLAPRALQHVGKNPAAVPVTATAMAEGHLSTVLEYVRGYTRGRGFHGYIPERPLQAVIVAATGRLFTNPEQVTYYSTGDYSERPATLTGWTLAELQVLRRYRRVAA